MGRSTWTRTHHGSNDADVEGRTWCFAADDIGVDDCTGTSVKKAVERLYRGVPVKRREIADELGLSLDCVTQRLNRARLAGIVQRAKDSYGWIPTAARARTAACA